MKNDAAGEHSNPISANSDLKLQTSDFISRPVVKQDHLCPTNRCWGCNSLLGDQLIRGSIRACLVKPLIRCLFADLFADPDHRIHRRSGDQPGPDHHVHAGCQFRNSAAARGISVWTASADALDVEPDDDVK